MPVKRYFPGLNAIRAYAALSVVFGHLANWSQVSLPLNAFILDGNDAVGLFFVLSGFLIGTLLIEEHERTGTINLPHFYQRRARRILPLYLLVIVLTVLLAPQQITLAGLLVVLTFTGDLSRMALGAFSVYWSLAVEEKFYLFAPLLLRRFSVPMLALTVIVVRGLLMIVFAGNADVIYVLTMLRFDAMALGVFGAWLVYRQRPLLSRLYRLELPALVLALAVIVFTPLARFYLFDLALSLVFMVIIVSTASKPRPLFCIKRGVLDRVGVLSYGIYLYHTLFIQTANGLSFTAFAALGALPAALAYVVAYYGFVVGGTLLAAHLSYYHFEQPFLRQKQSVKRTPVVA